MENIFYLRKIGDENKNATSNAYCITRTSSQYV